MEQNGEHKSDSESEITSQSSEEAVFTTDLPGDKGNKKTVQAKLDTSPKDSHEEVKDTDMQSEEQHQEGAKGEETEGVEQGFTPTSDIFGGSPLFGNLKECSART
jgi:hypothetical protein